MNRDEKYTVIVGCGQLGASLANAISDVGGTRGVQRICALYLSGVGGYSGYWEEWEAAILSIKQDEMLPHLGRVILKGFAEWSLSISQFSF